MLTRPHNGHAACHYCGACGKGCDVGAFFNSSDYLIEPAFGTGRLKVIDNAVVARVLTGDDGRASGVQYFDRYTKEERTVRARVVVVAASCIDSTRILLNSKSRRHPNGIGNSSDVIGRYLSEQVRLHMFGFVPELLGAPVQNDDGIGGEHVYMPRFNHRDGRKRDYLRGFGMQFWGCGAGDNAGWAKQLPGFGAEFKSAVRKRYPAVVALHPYGEVLPYAENRITIDPTAVDDYGVPVARIDFKYRENERKMMTEMYQTAAAILKSAKAEILPYDPTFYGRSRTGDPRAFHLPHGRRPEAQRAERILPDARREERLRGGRRGLHHRFGEEPHADHSGPRLARDGLPGRRNEGPAVVSLLFSFPERE